MSSPADIFTVALAAAREAAAQIPDALAAVKSLDDATLLVAQRELSEIRRLVDSRASLVAGEVAFRSRRELGYRGLAQKEGFRTPEKLVQATTGSTRRDATTLVTAGNLIHEAMVVEATDPDSGEIPEGFSVDEPWLTAVGAAVARGSITVEAATAIRNGLGEPSPAGTDGAGLTAEGLSEAALALLAEATGGKDAAEAPATESAATGSAATGLNADELHRRARELRDELDEAGIAERERLVHEQRSFRRVRRPNGSSRFILDGDLETSAWLDDVYDKLTSPRRGGPRFIDPADQVWAEQIVTDSRSTEQYLHDAMIGLLHKGVDSDLVDAAETSGNGDLPTGDRDTTRLRRRAPRIVGSRTPAVRVLVTEEALRTRAGHGRIDGTDSPVSIETVERIICTSGTIPIAFGPEGNVLDLGRESRLFSARQKLALAARDGGCLWPGCDRRADWTEAHHIDQWARDHGNTDLADGVLLCRHHHLLLHNNHWEVVRKGNDYWLIPPPEVDPAQKPRPLTSKSAALRDLQHERRRDRHREREDAAPREREHAAPRERDDATGREREDAAPREREQARRESERSHSPRRARAG